MLTEIKNIMSRSRDTVIEDSIGVISLFALLIAGLYLSGST